MAPRVKRGAALFQLAATAWPKKFTLDYYRPMVEVTWIFGYGDRERAGDIQ
jgi:hypothetical protein